MADETFFHDEVGKVVDRCVKSVCEKIASEFVPGQGELSSVLRRYVDEIEAILELCKKNEKLLYQRFASSLKYLEMEHKFKTPRGGKITQVWFRRQFENAQTAVRANKYKQADIKIYKQDCEQLFIIDVGAVDGDGTLHQQREGTMISVKQVRFELTEYMAKIYGPQWCGVIAGGMNIIIHLHRCPEGTEYEGKPFLMVWRKADPSQINDDQLGTLVEAGRPISGDEWVKAIDDCPALQLIYDLDPLSTESNHYTDETPEYRKACEAFYIDPDWRPEKKRSPAFYAWPDAYGWDVRHVRTLWATVSDLGEPGRVLVEVGDCGPLWISTLGLTVAVGEKVRLTLAHRHRVPESEGAVTVEILGRTGSQRRIDAAAFLRELELQRAPWWRWRDRAAELRRVWLMIEELPLQAETARLAWRDSDIVYHAAIKR